MKYDTDLSIFESPNHPYGNVTGELELRFLPSVGAVVRIRDEMLELRVQFINVFNRRTVIGFDDVVADSPRHAAWLAGRLERDERQFYRKRRWTSHATWNKYHRGSSLTLSFVATTKD